MRTWLSVFCGALFGLSSLMSCAHSGTQTPALTTIDVTLEDGSVTSLTYLLGKVVFLDICAAYHGPCLLNAQAMNEASSEIGGDEVAFVSMVLDEGMLGEEAVRAYKEVAQYHQQVVRPGPQSWAGKSALGRLGIPRLLVFDKAGNLDEEASGATISATGLMRKARELSAD